MTGGEGGPLRPRLLVPLRFEARGIAKGLACHGGRHGPHDSLASLMPIAVGPGDGPARWIEREARPGELLILAGTAGGLRAPAVGGAAFIVTRVFDASGALRATSTVPVDPSLKLGPVSVVHVDATVATVSAKRALADKVPAATLIDMESLPFAEAAERRGLPWIIVRGVSDGPDDALPAEVMQWVTATGDLSWSGFLGSLARRPALVAGLPAIARRSNRALRAIAQRVADVIAASTTSTESTQSTQSTMSAVTVGLTPPAPILLFGGTFDPPQRAHVELPIFVARRLRAERVILIPAAGNPLKPDSPASAADRLAMLRLALEGVGEQPPVEVSTIELDRPPPSYTVDTLRAIATRPTKGRPLLLLVGADAALSFPRWREPEAILALATPVVLLRPPHDRAAFAQELARIHPPAEVSWWLDRVIEAPFVEASSSEVRRRLESGEPVGDLLDPRVEAYIRERGLYGTPPPDRS